MLQYEGLLCTAKPDHCQAASSRISTCNTLAAWHPRSQFLASVIRVRCSVLASVIRIRCSVNVDQYNHQFAVLAGGSDGLSLQGTPSLAQEGTVMSNSNVKILFFTNLLDGRK
mmetsp:Transcript_65646/g.136737  ORF Transcript_65646/g.136737 Transcript_65646/m.136737 type:complete len:113 (-) Transcript_65646:858-1196(-)